MRAVLLVAIVLAPALAGCARLPVARGDAPQRTTWPVLLPIDEITGVQEAESIDPALALEARAARLRARAAALAAADI